MVKVFASEITEKEKALAVLFFVFAIVGMGLGATFDYYILMPIFGSYESMPRPLFYISLWVSMFVSMFMAIPFFSVPLFLLVLRPFYTRKSISRFLVSGRNPNLPPKALSNANLAYKVGFFWINLFYPEDKSDD